MHTCTSGWASLYGSISSNKKHSSSIASASRAGAHLGLQVGADAHHTSLHGHLEGEADDAADLQQGLLTHAPPSLTTTTTTTQHRPWYQDIRFIGPFRRGFYYEKELWVDLEHFCLN